MRLRKRWWRIRACAAFDNRADTFDVRAWSANHAVRVAERKYSKWQLARVESIALRDPRDDR